MIAPPWPPWQPATAVQPVQPNQRGPAHGIPDGAACRVRAAGLRLRRRLPAPPGSGAWRRVLRAGGVRRRGLYRLI